MKLDNHGKTIITPDEAFAYLYSGKISNLENLYFEDAKAVDLFNKSVKENADDISAMLLYTESKDPLELFDKSNQKNWFMPDEYKNIDIAEFLISRCPEQNYQRVVDELELFAQHGMIELLHYLKYLVDTMRENKIVWGVGRGSSVASYVLYLIGVHKIDSIKYNLDIKEFLK